MTGWFGEGRRGHRHMGIDFDGNTGDPVVAAAAGTVAHAGPAPAGYGGYGTVVIIDHGGGVETLYAHLSAVFVRAGQPVAAGTRVGSIGTSGHTTGSHLHFELHIDGRAVDPARWLTASG
jgi:murein DD-endopeptidase MepM/ murein hydrolase activator NlpD